jgi:hypothetical protein
LHGRGKFALDRVELASGLVEFGIFRGEGCLEGFKMLRGFVECALELGKDMRGHVEGGLGLLELALEPVAFGIGIFDGVSEVFDLL